MTDGIYAVCGGVSFIAVRQIINVADYEADSKLAFLASFL